MLDDTDNYIKDNLQNILDGKFDDKFKPDQLKMMLELSFLYNHINRENYSFIFEYGTEKITFRYNESQVNRRLVRNSNYLKETIVNHFLYSVVFKSALKQFLRDKKINDILE